MVYRTETDNTEPKFSQYFRFNILVYKIFKKIVNLLKLQKLVPKWPKWLRKCLLEATFKSFKVKVLSAFRFDTILTMLNALWWIYKKAHHKIFDFMFLVSSVLSVVSKPFFLSFGSRLLELFQCSAEGWSLKSSWAP